MIKNANVMITMMIPKEIKAKVEEKAKESGLSVSAWIRMVILKELNKN